MEQRRRKLIKTPSNQGLEPTEQTRQPQPPGRGLSVRPKPFSLRYKRVTTYLENELYHRLHRLNRAGDIPSITAVLNAALRGYLDRHYLRECPDNKAIAKRPLSI